LEELGKILTVETHGPIVACGTIAGRNRIGEHTGSTVFAGRTRGTARLEVAGLLTGSYTGILGECKCVISKRRNLKRPGSYDHVPNNGKRALTDWGDNNK